MPVIYQISYTPERFYVAPTEAVKDAAGNVIAPRYFAICSNQTRQPVAFAFDENFARTVCLALELVRCQLYGDKKKTTALLKLIEKLAVSQPEANPMFSEDDE